MREKILLLHGLWMRQPALWPLAARLRRAGFDVEPFGYSSLWHQPEYSMEKLASRMATFALQNAYQQLHVVAHSLGGLMAIATMNRYEGLPHGRVVCLGSPVLGSSVARALAHNHLGFFTGRSGVLLRSGLMHLPAGREVGMIAGTKSMGLGRWVADFDGVNDGTVAVWETRLPGLHDHVIVPCSHTGLIYNQKVADLTVNFLQTGYFRP
jgi:pimeloyl-ACP methyl ester carboxylesterase